MRKPDPIEDFLVSDADEWLREAVAMLSDRENRLPMLLELVCTHPECPNWLKDSIWDCVNANTHETPDFSSHWFRKRLLIDGDAYSANGERLPLRLAVDHREGING